MQSCIYCRSDEGDEESSRVLKMLETSVSVKPVSYHYLQNINCLPQLSVYKCQLVKKSDYHPEADKENIFITHYYSISLSYNL